MFIYRVRSLKNSRWLLTDYVSYCMWWKVKTNKFIINCFYFIHCVTNLCQRVTKVDHILIRGLSLFWVEIEVKRLDLPALRLSGGVSELEFQRFLCVVTVIHSCRVDVMFRARRGSRMAYQGWWEFEADEERRVEDILLSKLAIHFRYTRCLYICSLFFQIARNYFDM